MSQKHLLRYPIGPASKSQSRQRPFLKGILVILEREEKNLTSFPDVQQECVVCGTVYVTGTGEKTQGLDPLVLGTLSGSRREETTTSSVSVESSNATAKGKDKASPFVPPVRYFKSRLLMILCQVVTYVSPAIGISHTATVTSAFPAVTSSLSRDSNLPPQISSSHAFSEVGPPISEAMSHSFRIHFSQSQRRMTFSLARVRPLGPL